jgi:hypothetical protein
MYSRGRGYNQEKKHWKRKKIEEGNSLHYTPPAAGNYYWMQGCSDMSVIYI